MTKEQELARRIIQLEADLEIEKARPDKPSVMCWIWFILLVTSLFMPALSGP